MGYGYGNSSAGAPPKGQNVYVEEDFDENGNSLGFFVKIKGNPPRKIRGPFSTEGDAIFWLQSNGYTQIPKP